MLCSFTQAYIKWELSNTGGLPTVRFDLGFRTPPDPAPPPNYPVPERPPEATMTSDIYCTPYVLAEVCFTLFYYPRKNSQTLLPAGRASQAS
jgi:hypothetical protein